MRTLFILVLSVTTIYAATVIEPVITTPSGDSVQITVEVASPIPSPTATVTPTPTPTVSPPPSPSPSPSPTPTPTPTPVQTISLTVSWTWGQTAGDTYELYYGTASGVYEQAVSAHNGMTLNLEPNMTYYFALSTVRHGMESEKGPEVSYKTTPQLKQALTLPTKF